MKKNILCILIFGFIAGVLVSLLEILIDHFNGCLDLITIYKIYFTNITAALLFSILTAILILLINQFLLHNRDISGKKLVLLSLSIPFMLSLFIPKIFIDYLLVFDLGKLGIYIGCLTLLFLIHMFTFERLVEFLISQKWRYFSLIIIGFILVGLSICSVDEFHAEDQLFYYQDIKEKKSDVDPNIIFIVIDALRPDALPSYGNEIVQAPHISSIAENGVVFKEAYTALPKTLPSMCSFLTGLYPRTHGILEMGIPLKEKIATIAELLKLKGYRTSAMVANYVLKEEISGLKQGFDYYRSDFPEKKQAISIQGRFNPLVEKRADSLTDSILHWLENNYTSKFFIWAHYMDPHAAYDPPPPFNRMYSNLKDIVPNFKIKPELIHYQAKIEAKDDFLYYLSRYYGEVSFCDEQIGRLLEFLRHKEIYQNTLIIITADHGESFGEHNRFFSHGHNLYQENIRIPLILSLPSIIGNGKEIDTPVLSIDIVPTILQLLRIEPASYVQGEDLLPLIDSKKKERDNQIIVQAYGGEAWALIQDDWKLIYQIKGRKYKLFNLSQDPQEQEDLSQKYSSKIYQMRKLLGTVVDNIPNNTIINQPRLKQLQNSLMLRISGKKRIPLDQREDLTQEVKQRLKSLGYIQ